MYKNELKFLKVCFGLGFSVGFDKKKIKQKFIFRAGENIAFRILSFI